MKPEGNELLDNCATFDPYQVKAVAAVSFCPEAEQNGDCLLASALLKSTLSQGVLIDQQLAATPPDDYLTHRSPSSLSVAEFVIHKFIPECVANRRSSARSHFRTILNHILRPELVREALSSVRGGTKRRLSTIPGWPYVDSLKLPDVDTVVIQRLAHTALAHGYSSQMARQIRNVMSLIMSHAIRIGYYTGPNPATSIALQATPQKELHALDLAQLTTVLGTMVYPEKHIAMCLMLAELRVTEVCGLQWKYVNLSPSPRVVEGEIIPPKTIAVRNQTYRGEFTNVVGSRRRFVRIPDLLCSVLRELKSAHPFSAPDNFVLASRNGTPVHPENIAARRLKSIGRSLEMPWLSWSVFVRTRTLLRSQPGRGAHEQLQKALNPGRASGTNFMRFDKGSTQ